MESNQFITPRQADAVAKVMADALRAKTGKHQYHILAEQVQRDLIENAKATDFFTKKVLDLMYFLGIGRYDIEYPDCGARVYYEDIIYVGGNCNRVAHVVPVKPGDLNRSFESVAVAICYILDHGNNWVVDDTPSLRKQIIVECGNCSLEFSPQHFESADDAVCPVCQQKIRYSYREMDA